MYKGCGEKFTVWRLDDTNNPFPLACGHRTLTNQTYYHKKWVNTSGNTIEKIKEYEITPF